MRRLWILGTGLVLAACGGGGEEAEAEAGAGTQTGVGADTAAASVPPPIVDTSAPLPPGTVDTLGTGVNPPTAGGALIDTAAVPGPTDTVAGTPTRP